jgi:predicted RNA binding protein YcfA (HicA-like mRNA interferase family)
VPGLNFREFIEILEAHGFELARQESSHRRYKGRIAAKPNM